MTVRHLQKLNKNSKKSQYMATAAVQWMGSSMPFGVYFGTVQRLCLVLRRSNFVYSCGSTMYNNTWLKTSSFPIFVYFHVFPSYVDVVGIFYSVGTQNIAAVTFGKKWLKFVDKQSNTTTQTVVSNISSQSRLN